MKFDFEYNGDKYRYDYGDLQRLGKYDFYNYVCEIRISNFDSYTEEERINLCRSALQGYYQGVEEGKSQVICDIKKYLEIE